MAYNKKSTDTQIPPIGAIIAWAKSLGSVTPQTLPIGWAECNGQTLSDPTSIYHGRALPSLNGTNKFLRGNSTSGGTGGAATHTHGVSGTTSAPGVSIYVASNPAWGMFVDQNQDGVTAYVSSADHDHTISSSAFDHTHTYSGTSDAASSNPSYYDVVYIIRIK